MASSNTNNNDEGTASATTSNIADANTANNSDPAAAAVAMVEQRTVQVHPLPLDWTQMGGTLSPPNRATTAVVRYPSDVAELVPEETEICIVGTAGQKITALGENFSSALSHPEQLTRLILRSHVIRTMEGLQHLTHLELLELYDNQVEALSCLNQGVNGAPGITLRILDMSYNVIRDMEPVAFCPNLQELYLANNKLKTMAGLKGLSQLKKIDLGANRIRTMDPDELSGLISLEELWLGKNKIEHIQGLEKLTKLRRLDIQSNRLTTVENLGAQTDHLEELYLAHNAITTEGAMIASGLAQIFASLSVLDLSRNRLTTTQPFGHLKGLEELWLSGNKIATLEDVQPIAHLPGLDTIYLEYNPLQHDDPLYRKRLAELIPSLKQIDANLIAGNGSFVTTTTPTPQHVLVFPDEERLRQLQDLAVARALAETRGGEKHMSHSKE